MGVYTFFLFMSCVFVVVVVFVVFFKVGVVF